MEPFASPQVTMHLRNRSATVDGSTAATAEARKSAQYARPRHCSFDECSLERTTVLVMEGFGCLGKSGEKLVDRITASLMRKQMEARLPARAS